MSIENDKLTAAATPLTLKGKEWRLKPLADIQIEEINQWVRAQHVKIAVLAAKGLQIEDYDRVISVALKDAHSLTWTEGIGLDIVGEPAGFAYILWQSLRKEHPELTHMDVRELLIEKQNPKQTQENYRLCMAIFREANRIDIKNVNSPVEGSALPPG